MGSLFGTDGVRGVANTELTPELALGLGRALGASLPGERRAVGGGRGTRPPGGLLGARFWSRLLSAGGSRSWSTARGARAGQPRQRRLPGPVPASWPSTPPPRAI